MAGTPSEYDLMDEVIDRLNRLGVLLQPSFPIKEAGLRVDLLCQTPGGRQFVVEFKSRIGDDLSEFIEAVNRRIELTREAVGIDDVFFVVASLGPGHQIPNVLTVGELEDAVKALLDKETHGGVQHEVLFPSTESRSIEEPDNPPATIFVAMPFATKFEDTFFLGIVEAAREVGVVCARMDQEILDDLVIEEIHNGIRDSAGVVVDVTGAKPNVMYELGYAKALGKITVQISAGSADELPFDVRGWQTLFYAFGQVHQLRNQLVPRLKRIAERV